MLSLSACFCTCRWCEAFSPGGWFAGAPGPMKGRGSQEPLQVVVASLKKGNDRSLGGSLNWPTSHSSCSGVRASAL